MRNFEVEFNGQKLKVEATPLEIEGEETIFNRYKVVFPDIVKKGMAVGQVVFGTPTKDGDGNIVMEWCHRGGIKGVSDAIITTILKPDGQIVYNTLKNKTPIFDPEKFDPNANREDSAFLMCKRMYNLAKKIEEHEKEEGKLNPNVIITPHVNNMDQNNLERTPDNSSEQSDYDKLGISPDEVLELRKEILKTALTLLGESEEKKPSFFVLAQIGDRLKQYYHFGSYVRRKVDSSKRESFEVKLPEDFNKEEFLENVKRARERIKKDKSFIETQTAIRDQRSDFLENFGGLEYSEYCLDISQSSTITPEEAAVYKQVVLGVVTLYKSINADLLPYYQSAKISNSVSISDELLKRRIANILESKPFKAACSIEKKFVKGEAARFSSFINKTLEENQKLGISGFGKTLLALQEDAILDIEPENSNGSLQVKPEEDPLVP